MTQKLIDYSCFRHRRECPLIWSPFSSEKDGRKHAAWEIFAQHYFTETTTKTIYPKFSWVKSGDKPVDFGWAALGGLGEFVKYQMFREPCQLCGIIIGKRTKEVTSKIRKRTIQKRQLDIIEG
jgi:hypothetical protein